MLPNRWSKQPNVLQYRLRFSITAKGKRFPGSQAKNSGTPVGTRVGGYADEIYVDKAEGRSDVHCGYPIWLTLRGKSTQILCVSHVAGRGRVVDGLYAVRCDSQPGASNVAASELGKLSHRG